MSLFKLTRVLGAGLLTLSVLATPAFARGGHHSSHSGHSSHAAVHHAHHGHKYHHGYRHVRHRPLARSIVSHHGQPNESALREHGHYRNSDGVSVHSPAHSVSGAAPSGASAQCSDGTYSFSQHRRGTCSHHGGVASWL